MEHIYKNISGWFTFPELYKSIVNNLPEDNSHIVEIGTWKGQSAAFMAVEIANSGKKIKFDCIDTWLGSQEHKENNNVKKNNLYELFLKNIDTVKQYINPIRMCSVDASKLYADESLDFVFIDASHEYEDVVADINSWYPKVKKGGILAGHDYRPVSWPGVRNAVDNFFSENGGSFEVSEMCWVHKKC